MRLHTNPGLLALLCLSALRLDAQTPLNEAQKQLGIPPSIARVTDAFSVSRDRTPDFVLIQDLHEHIEAQGAIASILLYGRRAWNLETVFVEGACGPLNPAAFERNASGAQRAALMDPDRTLSLYGIEDWSLYTENLKAYQNTKRLEKAALDELETIQRIRQALGSRDSSRWDRLRSLVRLEWLPKDAIAFWQQGGSGVIQSPALAQATQVAETFYRLADLRSEVFLDKSNEKHVSGPRVLVVGGFHTTAMAERLRQEGKSFVVLTPRITRVDGEERYAERMQESLSALRLCEASR